MIYFLQHIETGLVKIGKTNNYDSRKASLDKQYGQLKLLGFMDGYTELEQSLHRKFKHIRRLKVLTGVEWFTPTLELMDYIEKYASDNTPQSDSYYIVSVPKVVHEVFNILQHRYKSVSLDDAVIALLKNQEPELMSLAEEALTIKERLESIYGEETSSTSEADT